VEVLSVPEIAEEIARSFDFLTAEMRDAPRRQWSIRAVFEPTWQRLSEMERDVFKRLSVFRGGCTRQAAQAATDASLPVLQALVNKAVLTRTPRGRYEIHELLRQYAEDRLIAAGEEESARDTHCTYYAEFMHARVGDLKGGDRQIAALDEIEADFENVRAAWDWAVERRRLDDLGHMEWTVGWFLEIRNRYSDALTLFQHALKLDQDRVLYGRLMAHYAGFCYDMGRRQESDEWSDKSLAIARETGDPDELALALRLRAIVLATYHRDLEQAHRLIDESLHLWQALGDTWGVAYGLHGKGYIASSEGDFPSALSFTEEALKQGRAIDDRLRIADGLLNAGVGYAELGEPHQALHYYEESLTVFRELNTPIGMCKAIGNMANIAQHLGDYDTALRQLEEALVLAREWGYLPEVVDQLLNSAEVLSLAGRFEEAAERLAECRRVLSSIEEDAEQEAGLLIYQGMVAYRRADYGEALRYAQAGLAYTQARHHVLIESVCWLLNGLAEIKLGHPDMARQHIRASLPGLRVKSHLMIAIYCMAALEASGEQPERAVERAALVHHYQASTYEFKVYAGNLLAELQTVLPPDIYAAAVERGMQFNPDAVVAAFLEEENP
jgi:tetratricopeptide (TPR) repeat protein